jgi:hypothetical protein
VNKRLTITLPEIEKKALHELAEREYRDTQAQAALIIRTELERRGLLNPNEPEQNTTIANKGSNG